MGDGGRVPLHVPCPATRTPGSLAVINYQHNAHDKYQRGKSILSSAAGDPEQMGLALMARHGALEDQICERQAGEHTARSDPADDGK
jgi:hypothetical protein